MWVNSLKVRNFRNYTDFQLNFSKGVNFIQGDNGTGKTSLVEAISLLNMCRSIRTSNEMELIKFNEESAIIESQIENQIKRDFKIVLSKKGKYIELDGNVQKKVSSIVGVVKIITFLPKDVDLLKQFPQKRRKFIDSNFSMIDYEYLKLLSEYNYYLQEIRELLKGDKIDDIVLEVLLHEISKKGFEILKKRLYYFKLINEYLKKISMGLFKENDLFNLKYVSTLKNINSIDDYYNELQKSIKKERLKDKNKIIVHGIHLDDFILEYKNFDLSLYGSQGENRISIIALKLSLYEFIKEKYDEEAIIILDDVLSELDEINQRRLIKYLTNIEQVFITGTKFNLDIPVALYTVKNNKIWRNN